MPAFLIPLHEFNSCHSPEGPGGGQFCSQSGRDLSGAQLVKAGQPLDIVAAANAGDSRAPKKGRRFLFSPKSRELVLGVATGTVGRDQSHAEALDRAEPEVAKGADPLAHARRYDTFNVHGHVQTDTSGPRAGKLAIVIDRVVSTELTGGGFNREAREVEALDFLYAAVARLVALGAPKDTQILARDLGGKWVTLGKTFPSLFKRAPRKKAA